MTTLKSLKPLRIEFCFTKRVLKEDHKCNKRQRDYRRSIIFDGNIKLHWILTKTAIISCR